MKFHHLTLRQLCFTGPDKDAASIDFKGGLNVIHGASETGKSFILEAIDFVLGAGDPLRDIKELNGYDRVLLGIEWSGGEPFTLVRSVAGGRILCYPGLHYKVPSETEPLSLLPKADRHNEQNISHFLLEKLGINSKELIKNQGGAKNKLGFRQLAQLAFVPEEKIQKRESPIESGIPQNRTFEYSVFGFLLTGVDDSAYEPSELTSQNRLSRSAKVEVLDELITDYQTRLSELIEDDETLLEIDNKLTDLNAGIHRQQTVVRDTESLHRDLIFKRTDLRAKVQTGKDRRVEIDELLGRFALLDEHYQSDLERLEGLREAGTLFSAMSIDPCPLCGAAPDTQHQSGECDGNVGAVVDATDAETEKIKQLQNELTETVSKLREEAQKFDTSIPLIEANLGVLGSKIEEMNPTLSSQRELYSELLEQRVLLQSALNLFLNIAELKERKANLPGSNKERQAAAAQPAKLSASVLNEFSQVVENILKAWEFPESSRVHFEKQDKDIVVGGKPRGSRGKGMRAITYAAFIVALLEFTRQNSKPHPGFVIIDTPLLAYREPEGEDDDLSGTAVKDRFYENLVTMTERQVIVLENIDPPGAVTAQAKTTFFSKNPHSGRYGLFPYNE